MTVTDRAFGLALAGYEWPHAAETWTPDPRYPGTPIVGLLYGEDDDDRRHEADTLLLGHDVADALVAENGGPEYRAFERVDALYHRARWATVPR